MLSLLLVAFLSPGGHACESFVAEALDEVQALISVESPSLDRADFTAAIRVLDALVPPLRQCVAAHPYKRYMGVIADVTVLRVDLEHTVKAIDRGLYASDPLIRNFWRKKALRFLDAYRGE